MLGVAPCRPVSVAEYLAEERQAMEKHILWDGQSFAMAGASRRHNQLVAAILRDLGVALLGKPCTPYASDQRVHVPLSSGYVYPDASVTCSPVQTAPEDDETITNPRVVVEVLSESTEAFDRGEKFRGYASIPSLEDYVLLAQDGARVEVFTRQPDGWLLRRYAAGETVTLASIHVSLAVDALYTGVLEPAEPSAAGERT
jgi:Uma2 family endonuclease